MILYFFRHGSAGEPKGEAGEDGRRPLDGEGVQQCTMVGLALHALEVEADTIVSSPLKRAMQSADLVAQEIGYEDEILCSEALRPEATYQQFSELLSEFHEDDCILLVGHNHKLAEFLGKLISPGGRAAIRLKKGAIAKVQHNRKGAVLHWCITPKLLRASFNGSELFPAPAKRRGRRSAAGNGRRAGQRGSR